MITFDEKNLKNMRTAQLEEIIALYLKTEFGDKDVLPKTNPERVHWITAAMNAARGYPHVCTEEWLKENGPVAEDLKVGDVIIVPFPSPEEAVRDGALHDAAMVFEAQGYEPEVRDAKLAELAAIEDTTVLVDTVQALMKEHQAPQDDQAGASNAKGEADTKAEEDAVSEAFGDVSDEDIKAKIDRGLLKYDGQTIVKYSPRIAFGTIRYELYAGNGCTFTVTKGELAKLIELAV